MDTLKRFEWHIVLHTLGVIGLLIIVVCFNTCHRPVQHDYDKLHKLCDSVITNNECLSNSLKYDLSKDKTIKSDTLKRYIAESQKKINLLVGENKFLSSRLDEVVNDIRQETNNNICNLNLWLAFAVCLLSLVGVVIPVAMQFKISADSRNEYSDLKNKFEQEYRQLRLKTEVVQSISTLVSGFDNKVWVEYSNRDEMIQLIWSYLISYFAKYIDQILDCKEDCDKVVSDKVILLEVLIHINAFIRKVRMTNKYKDKKLSKITDSIRALIINLNTNKNAYLYTQDFKDSVKDIKDGLCDIDFTKMVNK